MTLDEWLQVKTEHTESELSAPTRIPRYQRMAFLFFCNGASFKVNGWGYIGYSGGPFRQGLDQDEALELIEYAAFLQGVEFCGVDVTAKLMPLFDAYLKERNETYYKEVGDGR